MVTYINKVTGEDMEKEERGVHKYKMVTSSL
jgi:hypothetical protein